MTKLKLHYPTGHPYWQRNKFKIEIDNGEFIDCWKHSKYQGQYGEEYEIFVTDKGIEVQYFMCSSGGGKRAYSEKFTLINSDKFNEIEYVGVPLEISPTLAADISEQGY